jgi:hypothetical protein
MTCDKVRDVLPLYLSGELKGEELADIERHVQGCERCALAVSADRELDDAFRTAMLEETPDVSGVLGRVHERMTASWWTRMPRLVSVRVAAAIAMVIIIALVGLPWFYVHQTQRTMALEAVNDHYGDLVLLRHPDWEYKPEDVARFIQQQFPQKQDLLRSITPQSATFEKVRVCNLRGTSYAHFVFNTPTGETSVFLVANPKGRAQYQAAHLSNGGYGLEVTGFSTSGMAGMVVGKQGSVPTREIANRLSQTL